MYLCRLQDEIVKKDDLNLPKNFIDIEKYTG